MHDLLAKISSYNIFNYLFPGAVFAVIGENIKIIDLPNTGIATQLLLYYLIGMIISRFGSLILEPLFGKFGFVIYSDYSDYIRASKKDDKIEILVEVANTYRTLIAAFAALPVALLIRTIADAFSLPARMRILIIAIFLIALFAVSFRKQSGYILKRVNHYRDAI